jgi:hypothetical protein
MSPGPTPCPKAKTCLPARMAALGFALLAFFLSPPNLLAQQPLAPTELQVKAAFLYKFGAFVAWPNPAPSGPFAICVLGRDVFGQILDATVKGGTIDGKALVARRVVSISEASQCRILFVSSSEESRLKPILAELNKFPVLTVSDIPHFSDRGGMIEFVLENGRVRFDVNLASAEKSGLTLSSELLKVASVVKRSEGRD